MPTTFTDEISEALAILPGLQAGNRWQGFDVHAADGSTIRVTPIDGEWDAGFEVHHLTRNGISTGRMTVNAAGYSAEFVAECARAMIDR